MLPRKQRRKDVKFVYDTLIGVSLITHIKYALAFPGGQQSNRRTNSSTEGLFEVEALVKVATENHHFKMRCSRRIFRSVTTG